MINYKIRSNQRISSAIPVTKTISENTLSDRLAVKTCGNRGMSLNHLNGLKEIIIEAIGNSERVKIDGLGVFFPRIKVGNDGVAYCDGFGFTPSLEAKAELHDVECNELEN